MRRFFVGHRKGMAALPFASRSSGVLIVAAAAVLVAGGLQAQSVISITGRVYDDLDKALVANAAVAIENTSYLTYTDQQGAFSFANIPPGPYRLAVSAPGYLAYTSEALQVVTDITRDVRIDLVRKPVRVSDIRVVGRGAGDAASNVVVIGRERIARLQPANLADLLENVVGVYVTGTGSSAGRSEVRLRGSLPKQVLVLVDGHKVNPAGSGAVDFSTLPVDIVERVEVHPGGASAKYGPDALGGAVNIVTHQSVARADRQAEVAYSTGKWGAAMTQITAVNGLPVSGLATRFAYQHRYWDGDFPFSYTVSPRPTVHSGIRVNNASDMYNYFTSGLKQLGRKARLSFSGQVYRGTNGLPDRASHQNTSAVTTDRRKLITARLAYDASAAVQPTVHVAFSRYEQFFSNRRDAIAQQRYEDHYTNDIYSLRLAADYFAGTRKRLRSEIQFSRDILYHDDLLRPHLSMNRTVRSGLGVHLSGDRTVALPLGLPRDELTVSAAVRYDHARTSKDSTSWRDRTTSHRADVWSPSLSAALSVGDGTRLVIRGRYGRSFRLPSINALFWKGDIRSEGNPGLRPERAEHSEAGAELTSSWRWLKGSIGVTYFHSYVKDLVVWIQSGTVWRPVNCDAALTTGHEDYLEVSAWDEAVVLRYQNAIVTAQNKSAGHNSFNKQLTYTPHYTTTVSARLNFKMIHAAYTVRSVDLRYALAANTKWYDAYRVHDLSVGVRASVSRCWRLQVTYQAYNLTGENYVLITHYPLPGREWHLRAAVKYGVGSP